MIDESKKREEGRYNKFIIAPEGQINFSEAFVSGLVSRRFEG